MSIIQTRSSMRNRGKSCMCSQMLPLPPIFECSYSSCNRSSRISLCTKLAGAMASPSANFRLRLERSALFAAQREKYRQPWLRKFLELGEARCTKPVNGEVFESPDDCFQRLWDWGFSAGCFFVKGRHRTKDTTFWLYKVKLQPHVRCVS